MQEASGEKTAYISTMSSEDGADVAAWQGKSYTMSCGCSSQFWWGIFSSMNFGVRLDLMDMRKLMLQR